MLNLIRFYIKTFHCWQNMRRKFLGNLFKPFDFFLIFFSPNLMSVFSLLTTLLGLILIQHNMKFMGLTLLGISFLADGLDGHMARLHKRKKQRPLNPYIDDFLDLLKEMLIFIFLLISFSAYQEAFFILVFIFALLVFNLIMRYQRCRKDKKYFPVVPLYILQIIVIMFK